jgi:hypothetical protein
VDNSVEDGRRSGKKLTLAIGGGCLVLVLLVGGFVAAIGFFVFSLMKSNDAYQHAMELARHDPEVVAALGEPIKDGWLVTGHTEQSGGAGNAQVSSSLSGPKGSAQLYVEARMIAGQWHYDTLVVKLDGGRQVDLQRTQALAPPPR